MATLSFLYRKEYSVNDRIHVVIPTVGDILEDEDAYYGMVTAFTAMPIDLMVQLDDLGIDFTELTDYDVFLLLFNGIRESDSSLIFRDLNLSDYTIAQNPETGDMFLRNSIDPLYSSRKSETNCGYSSAN